MNDMEGPMSPAMQRWMMQNPGLFQQIMNRWNMSQPLPGKDPNHIEWTGPGQQDPAVYRGGLDPNDPSLKQNLPYRGGLDPNDPNLTTPPRPVLPSYNQAPADQNPSFDPITNTDIG